MKILKASEYVPATDLDYQHIVIRKHESRKQHYIVSSEDNCYSVITHGMGIKSAIRKVYNHMSEAGFWPINVYNLSGVFFG